MAAHPLDAEEIVVMSEPDLRSIAFPILDDAQIAELGQCTAAEPRSYKDGQTLVQIGQRDFPLFIVKSGEIEVIDYSGDEPRTVTVHRKGGFTGDVSHLTGAPSVIGLVGRRAWHPSAAGADVVRHGRSRGGAGGPGGRGLWGVRRAAYAGRG